MVLGPRYLHVFKLKPTAYIIFDLIHEWYMKYHNIMFWTIAGLPCQSEVPFRLRYPSEWGTPQSELLGIPDHTMNTMTTTNTMNTMNTKNTISTMSSIMFVEMIFKYYIILFAPKPPPLLALSSESSIKAWTLNPI